MVDLMNMEKKIVVYRIGSMGDFLISLRALHLIRQNFPDSKIALLTNLPVDGGIKAISPDTILSGSGLVDEYVDYGLGGKGGVKSLFDLMTQIRSLKAQKLVYLMPHRTKKQLIRDWFFFSFCGFFNIIGLNFSKAYHVHRRIDANLYESESDRLVRNLYKLEYIADADLSPHMRLSDEDKSMAQTMLSSAFSTGYLVACVGAKVELKNWEEHNWKLLLERLSKKLPDYPMVFIGSADEFPVCERLAAFWQGPKLNLAGRCSPRVSAAILQRARFLIGHDSGPMHLASAVGTPVLSIFSARDMPGIWFPDNPNAVILYKKTDCAGCRLEVGCPHQKKCILSISVDEVESSFWDLFAKTTERVQ